MKKSTLHCTDNDMYLNHDGNSINLIKLCRYFKLYHELAVEFDKNLKLNLSKTLQRKFEIIIS